MEIRNSWIPAWGFLLSHKPAGQRRSVKNLRLWRLGCWSSSSSGGTVTRSCAAPRRSRGRPSGRPGRGRLQGPGGPSEQPGGREYRCHFQTVFLKWLQGWSAHTCWSSSSSLQSVHTFRRLMHGRTTVLPSSTTYTAFCPSQKRCSLRPWRCPKTDRWANAAPRGTCWRRTCRTHAILWRWVESWSSRTGGSRGGEGCRSTGLCRSSSRLRSRAETKQARMGVI